MRPAGWSGPRGGPRARSGSSWTLRTPAPRVLPQLPGIVYAGAGRQLTKAVQLGGLGRRAAARCVGGGGAMTVLADVLQPLAGAIPSSLVSPASLAAVGATVHALPSTLTYHFGFECALGDPTPTADFQLAITAFDGGHRMLGMEPLPAAYLAHPVWARL